MIDPHDKPAQRGGPPGRPGLQRLALAVLGMLLVGAYALTPLASAASRHHRRASHNVRGGSARGLGPLSGLLPRSKLTLESAINVNLSKETVRLPIYPGVAPVPNHPGQTERVWYILEDASDLGAAKDLGVNYTPKLANIGIGDPAAVQTVTEDNPSPQANPFGPALIHFQGAPDFSLTRVAVRSNRVGPRGCHETRTAAETTFEESRSGQASTNSPLRPDSRS